MTHKQRLSHNWDAKRDEGGEHVSFFCSPVESLFFAPKAFDRSTCRGECGGVVMVKTYAKHARRWTESKAPLHWVVDKVYNEVVVPCPCRRCGDRRRSAPNYKALDGQPLEIESVDDQELEAAAAAAGSEG